MKTFKSFLTEIFQQHYPYGEPSSSVKKDDFDYHFQSKKDHHYNVNINHHHSSTFYTIPNNEKHAETSFTQHEKDQHPHRGKLSLTKNEKYSAAKVLSTVHHIINHHIKNHGITHLHFSADNNEPTRVKLYHHLASKLGNHYTSKNGDTHTNFTVHTKAE